MKHQLKILSIAAFSAGAIALAFTAPASADHRSGYSGGGWHGGGGYRHGPRHKRRMGQWFMKRYDENKDGKVTQAEIDGNRKARHAKYDADGDGKLSLEEFKGLWLEAYRRKMVRSFQRLDEDGDASVTLEEYVEPLAKLVERRDRDGDGALSRADRKRWHHRKHYKDGRESGDRSQSSDQ
ncbi:MAG: EF-hand domain-containing protein [Pseudomonadota bacterium]